MFTGVQFAEQAMKPKYDRIRYDQLDCQGFVEKVLSDLGVRKPNGKPYDWRGSNSMYRNYYSWRGTVEECIKQYGKIPVGAFVYMWKDSGEEEVGYHDGLGNCTHVGIYCGDNVVRDSTRTTRKPFRDGVGSRTLEGFNRVTLFSGLDYFVTNSYNSDIEGLLARIAEVRNILSDMEGIVNEFVRGNKTT